MEVIPLSVQLINWNEYIKLYKSVFGVSPTRGLDDSGISLSDPRAIIEVIKDPRVCYYSFACTVPSDIVLEIAISDITILSEEKKHDSLIILSSNLLVWEREILRYCASSYPHDIRKLFNQIYNIFYKNQIMYYKKKVLQDDTYTLTRGSNAKSWQI